MSQGRYELKVMKYTKIGQKVKGAFYGTYKNVFGL